MNMEPGYVHGLCTWILGMCIDLGMYMEPGYVL